MASDSCASSCPKPTKDLLEIKHIVSLHIQVTKLSVFFLLPQDIRVETLEITSKRGLEVVLDSLGKDHINEHMSESQSVTVESKHPTLTGLWTSAGLSSPPMQWH